MIVLDGAVQTTISAWALAAYPHEAVGFVLGEPLPTLATVTALVPVANLASTPNTTFVLDPVGWFQADAVAQQTGTAVLGIIHTHPDSPAVPSVHDARNAADVGRSLFWLIVSVTSQGRIDIRGWHWDGTEFIEDDVAWN
jgi:proteasome lid subunit RPN8/RPN11